MNKSLSPEDKAIYQRSLKTALLTAIGVVVVLGSLAYSGYQIANLNNKLRNIQVSIASANAELKIRRQEILTTKHQLEELQAQRDISKYTLIYVADGVNYYHQGAFEKAIYSYNKALQLEPDNQYVLNLLGYSQFKVDKLNESSKTLERALKLNPKSPWILLNLAKTKCAMLKYADAKKLINKIITEDNYFVNAMWLDAEFTNICRPIVDALRKDSSSR